MENQPARQRLRQITFAFWSNIAFTLFALGVFIRSLEKGSTWRVVCSAIGFAVFLGIAVLTYLQLRRVQKESQQE